MGTPDGNVPALVELIAKAAGTVQDIYAQSSKPYVPSLNDLSPHPLDTGFLDPKLNQAIRVLEGACAQLTATVRRPTFTLLNRVRVTYELGCLDVAVTFKIPDILLEQPEGMHISEIGKKSGVDPEKLGRILRLLATKHIFREVKHDVFSNNRLSLILLATHPLSNYFSQRTDVTFKATASLPDVLGDPIWGPSRSPVHTPFNRAYGVSEHIFKWFEGATQEGGVLGARFATSLYAAGEVLGTNAVVIEYPWDKLQPGSTVCDVGGNIGAISMQLAKKHPHLHVKLQDTPARIVQAQNEVWPKEYPEAIQENRVEFKAIDFLKESPIKGCDVYYLRNILHDWPDKECVTILSGVKGALTPSSRILIHEYVLQSVEPSVAEDGSSFDIAPEPLLPNYGVGGIEPYNLDISMMVVLNSKERTLQDFVKLGEEAGLQFVKFWPLSDRGLVEYRLAQPSQ